MPDPTYGIAHQRERERWEPVVASGQGRCTEVICLEPSRVLNPYARWDLAHDRANPGHYLGPSHPRCNRSEGAAFGNRTRGMIPTRWRL